MVKHSLVYYFLIPFAFLGNLVPKTAFGQIQEASPDIRLAWISYLIDGISPHCIYYGPSRNKKGNFYLEYWYKHGEKRLTIKKAKEKMSAWQQLIIAYGLGDSAKYFDTSFVKFVPRDGKLSYTLLWGFPLATMKSNRSDEITRLLALLNIIPFNHREYYTDDSVFIWLYRIPTLSPRHNLENYSMILSSVVQDFVFDSPGRIICVSFFDERKKWLETYISDPVDRSKK